MGADGNGTGTHQAAAVASASAAEGSSNIRDIGLHQLIGVHNGVNGNSYGTPQPPRNLFGQLETELHQRQNADAELWQGYSRRSFTIAGK